MLLYDWNKIFDVTKGSPSAMYLIIKMLVNKSIPRNKHDKIYKYINTDFSGDCFLVHPDILLYHAYKHSFRDIAQYIALASLRPLADYYASGKTTLDLDLCEISLEYFKDNSLLHIEEGQLHFLYEEVKQENIH